VLFLLWLWLDGCQSLTDSSLPEIFYPFGTDEGDSVVNIGHNTFAGAIEIPYTIFNYKKIYVSLLILWWRQLNFGSTGYGPFLPRDASAERGYEIACRLSVRPSVRPWRLGTVIVYVGILGK